MSPLNIEVLCFQGIWLQYMYIVYMKEKWKHCIPFASNLIDDGDRGSAPEKAKAY